MTFQGDEEAPTNRTDRPILRRRLLEITGVGAFTTTLAGCNFSDATHREFEATPYAVSPEGRQPFGFTEVATDTVEETRDGEVFGVEGSVSIVSHLFSYGLEAEPPESSAWRVPSDQSWSAGVVSTPAVDIVGEARNPLATRPLGELLVGETGQQFMTAMGLETDRPWTCGPQRIGGGDGTMLGEETRFGVFAGVLEDDAGERMAVAVYAGRIQKDGDAVLAGLVDRRPVGPDSERGPNCLTPAPDPAGGLDTEEAIDIAEAAVAQRIERELELAERIREAENEDRGSITLPQSPELNISNLRLVQIVEDSGLTGSANSMQDPPIVADQPTAVMFDLDPSNLGQIGSDGVKVWIEVGHQSPYRRRMNFWIRGDDLRDIRDSYTTAAKFHELARDGDPDTDPPIFAVDPDSVSIKITKPGSFGGHHTLETASTTVSNTATLSRTLKVGFIEVKDPKGRTGVVWDPGDGYEDVTISYGDANGRAANYVRSVNSSYEYLRRAYPGEVVAYRHDTPIEGKEMTHEVKDDGPDPDTATGPDNRQAWGRDHIEARATLNTVVQGSNFPTGGELYHSTVTESTAESMIRSAGLDVVVVILPRGTADGNVDYFDAHGVRADGKFIGRKKAVSAHEALADSSHQNDVGHATTTAQEIGHYFARLPYTDPTTHPFARTHTKNGTQRIDRPHASSNLESVGYTLVDGTFTLPNRFEISDGSFDPGRLWYDGDEFTHLPHTSYMSYTGTPKWADSRITNYLIQSEFDQWYSP